MKPDTGYDQRMISFHDRFPEIARKETKVVTLPDVAFFGLPAGDYLFVESYCNRKLSRCDCRRVFLNVWREDRFLATIGYGWENVDFYARWFGKSNPFYDPGLIAEIKGPILEPGGLQSKYSKQLLNLFISFLMDNTDFIEMLKTHYHMFKRKI